MTSKSGPDDRFSLRRWSQRKLEVARREVQEPARPPVSPVDAAAAARMPTTANATSDPAQSASASTATGVPALPPIDSLTIDSDFAPFFQPQVDESVKRAALKQLFRDPRFNIMDGLDTYIDDYTKADPIPSAVLEDLMQRRGIFPFAATTTDAARLRTDEAVGDRSPASTEPAQAAVTQVAPETALTAPDQEAPITSAAAPDAAPDTAGTEVASGANAKADPP